MAGQTETGAAGQLAHGGVMGATVTTDFGSFGIESTCGRCGGLIAQPGKVYGYAGKWCHCTTLDTDSIIRRAAEARDAEEKRRLTDLYGRKPPTITDWAVEQSKRPPEPELTAHDFVVWMRGFFAGRSAYPTDPNLEGLLRAMLGRVRS